MSDSNQEDTTGGDGVIPNVEIKITKDETRQESTGNSNQGGTERWDGRAAPA